MRAALLVSVVGVVLAVAVSACAGGDGHPAATSPSASGQSGGGSPVASYPAGPVSQPNVVFVLTDDLAMNLVQYMPHVLALQEAGTTFSTSRQAQT